MSQLGYIYRILRGSSFKRLAKVINRVHEKSGQSRVYTFFDMLWCAARYGAGYHDYLIFAFWDMNGSQRDTYVTRVRNKKLIGLVNDQSFDHIFTHKNEFNKRFRSYLHREYRARASKSLPSVLSRIWRKCTAM